MFLTELGENCFFPKMLATLECQQFELPASFGQNTTCVDIYYSKNNKTGYMYHCLSAFY